jgi:hypothetical protein
MSIGFGCFLLTIFGCLPEMPPARGGLTGFRAISDSGSGIVQNTAAQINATAANRHGRGSLTPSSGRILISHQDLCQLSVK